MLRNKPNPNILKGSVCSGIIIPESDVGGSTCAGMSVKPAYIRTLFLFCFRGQHDPVYPGAAGSVAGGWRVKLTKTIFDESLLRY